jgi:hypothetical protein
MRELSMLEVESVSGGNLGFALNVAAGVLGNYIYNNPGAAAQAAAAAAFPPYGVYRATSGWF